MNSTEFKLRTKSYGLRIIRLYEASPKRGAAPVLGKQLLRSGTSVGANYRAACRARSSADFISKMGIVEEEADESSFWVELLVDAGRLRTEKAGHVLKESSELVAISVSSINTARRNSTRRSTSPPAIPRSALRSPH